MFTRATAKPRKFATNQSLSVLTLAVGIVTLSPLCVLRGERPLPPISAPGAIALDVDTGAVIGSFNPDGKRGIASLTKMMTALVVVERYSSLDTVVGPVSSYAATYGGTTMGLRAGDRASIRDL